MDYKMFEAILAKSKVPEKVVITPFNEKYAVLYSAENTNDTYDWFHVNSILLEDSLSDMGFSWCYLIETVPNNRPFIYLFIGKELSKNILIKEMKDIAETLPHERKFYYEDAPFSSIIDKYDNSITELEQELTGKASDVFRVYKL